MSTHCRHFCRTPSVRSSTVEDAQENLLDLLCRNSLHPRTGPGPCPDCHNNPQDGFVVLPVSQSRKLLDELDPDYRQCSVCGQSKPKTAHWFYRSKENADGLNRRCKQCEGVYGKNWRAQQKRSGKARDLRRRKLLQAYHLSLQDFEELLAAQDGCCAICRSPEPQGADWAIDHDHRCCPGVKRSCGECVRGLLCVSCNIGLSYFNDDAEALIGAGVYLRAFADRRS